MNRKGMISLVVLAVLFFLGFFIVANAINIVNHEKVHEQDCINLGGNPRTDYYPLGVEIDNRTIFAMVHCNNLTKENYAIYIEHGCEFHKSLGQECHVYW